MFARSIWMFCTGSLCLQLRNLENWGEVGFKKATLSGAG